MCVCAQTLDQVSLNPSDVKVSSARKNPKKNRSNDFLPGATTLILKLINILLVLLLETVLVMHVQCVHTVQWTGGEWC